MLLDFKSFVNRIKLTNNEGNTDSITHNKLYQYVHEHQDEQLKLDCTKARQVGGTTFLIIMALWCANRRPNVNILFVCPRMSMHSTTNNVIHEIIKQSDIVQITSADKKSITLANDSTITFTTSIDYRVSRGFSYDSILIDEYDANESITHENITQLLPCIHHSKGSFIAISSLVEPNSPARNAIQEISHIERMILTWDDIDPNKDLSHIKQVLSKEQFEQEYLCDFHSHSSKVHTITDTFSKFENIVVSLIHGS